MEYRSLRIISRESIQIWTGDKDLEVISIESIDSFRIRRNFLKNCGARIETGVGQNPEKH